MKRFSQIAAMLLACSVFALAQPSPYNAPGVRSLVDKVHLDLNHAYGAWHFTNKDRDRLNHAEKQLREFSRKWDNGKFDKGDLDDAISSVQHVLDNNHLPMFDRDALSNDVTQMRNMREAYNRHEIGNW